MSGYPLQRLGLGMELEPGNPQEIESVLNPAAARALTANFTCFRGSSRGAIIRALALPGCGLVRLATRPESSGLALRSSLATFLPYDGIEFDGVDNKDASVFPVACANSPRTSGWPPRLRPGSGSKLVAALPPS
jgi:hypothetical protein